MFPDAPYPISGRAWLALLTVPRYALKIEYDGGPFAGWQRQDGPQSVQQCLEEALANLDPKSPRIFGAGRTDSGVHATGQVAHCDMSRSWPTDRLASALNAHLYPDPVAILQVSEVADDFHARFSAAERRYLYRMISRRSPPALDRGRVWQLRTPLSVERMREAAAFLVGKHDFTTFRSSVCQANSPCHTLDELTIREIPIPGGREVQVEARARSFLHRQVRSIVGSLMRVGAGNWSPRKIGAILNARDRSACAALAPPYGLYLTTVRYPDEPFDDHARHGKRD